MNIKIIMCLFYIYTLRKEFKNNVLTYNAPTVHLVNKMNASKYISTNVIIISNSWDIVKLLTTDSICLNENIPEEIRI